ncbi:MAG TPA: amidohydrolase family protein [Armatimonadota bacterium]|nr:amidohydrolase family protein [Armatimonadota bacterium]
MRIDMHMHLTQPVSLVADKLRKLGFDHGILCSSAVARGESVSTLADARAMMGRVADVQNKPTDQTVSQINNDIMAAVNEHPDLLWGFGKIDLFQSGIPETIAEISTLGMKGIGEIVGIHGNTGLLTPVFEAAGAHALPVFLHTDYPVDAEDLSNILRLAGLFPETQIILGHAGGDFWIDAIEGAYAHPNIWLDTSEIVNQVALQVAVNTIPDRVMFSSDFPWDSVESMLARIDALNNSHQVKEKVLGSNAASLFR